MKKLILTLFITILLGFSLQSQSKLVDRASKTYKTHDQLQIQGETGFLEVAENRSNPASRKVKVKYVWLKSLSDNPGLPIVFLEGAGGKITWQADSPVDLSDWTDLLEISDLIFVDRRTIDDGSLTYIWDGPFPEDFLISEDAANKHYQRMVKKALHYFDSQGVDITGYTIESHAHDVNDLMDALGLSRYSLYGFSFGSHISMAIMRLYPDRVHKAVLAGADAPNQAFNYPRYLETHLDKLSQLVNQDPAVNQDITDFKALVYRVMNNLETDPVVVSVTNPFTQKKIDLSIGAFGLALILRLDIDDYNDIPVIPRLLYNIDQGDYSILQWFVQKRLVFGLAVPADGINQQLASGASTSRWARILSEAAHSPFGNVVNFPFSAAKDHWPTTTLSFDPSLPVQTDIPTLFITGSLDCRTPFDQVKVTMKGFSNSHHVLVENAGHEQAHWDAEVVEEIIPAFLKGESIPSTTARYADLHFIKVKGNSKAHPSLR